MYNSKFFLVLLIIKYYVVKWIKIIFFLPYTIFWMFSFAIRFYKEKKQQIKEDIQSKIEESNSNYDAGELLEGDLPKTKVTQDLIIHSLQTPIKILDANFLNQHFSKMEKYKPHIVCVFWIIVLYLIFR